MNLDYTGVKQNLHAVKAEIDALLEYIESNQSQSDKRFIDIEIYSRLANVTTKILQSDRMNYSVQSEVKCTCGECESENQYYQCKGCKRIVPWCFGAADKYFDYCDDCAAKLSAQDEPEPMDERVLKAIKDSRPTK